MNNAMPRQIDWLNTEALPERWQDSLKPMVFLVECSGENHPVEWSPERGAVAMAHGEADLVVSALGGGTPTCMRLVEFMNDGVLAAAHMKSDETVVVPRWDAMSAFDDQKEAEKFNSAMSQLGNPLGVLLRGSPTRSLKRLVREAFLVWLRSTGLPLGDRIDVSVSVSSRLGEGGYGNVDKVIFNDNVSQRPLVGMQLCLGEGTTTRAVVCVSDSWLEEVSRVGVIRGGRFFLGDNGDGPVYSHLEAMFDVEEYRLVGGWAQLDNGFLGPQNMAGLMEAATSPVIPSDNFFVGAFQDWSMKGVKYRAEEGVHPTGVLRNSKDGQSWRVIADFVETFLHMDDLRAYSDVLDTEIVEGFDVDTDDVKDWLSCVVRDGNNPFFYVVPTATVEVVPDLR
jgi:hypothetical protein